MRRYYSYPYKAEPLHFPVEPIARKFTAVAIFVCIALVFFNLAAHAALDPQKLAESELEMISKDYYENYYYDLFTSKLPEEDYVVALTTYSEYGLPMVYLRELLLFDEGRHADSRSYFEGQYYCNTNRTGVRIIPHPPFGKTDYELKFTYDCEWQ